MSVSLASLVVLLLGAPPEPAERFLEQKEWHGEILFRRFETQSGAGYRWSKNWRAKVTFRLGGNEVNALARSREKEARNKKVPPEVREAYERALKDLEKSLTVGVWMVRDLKQEEELWLTESSERWSKCGGSCGNRRCPERNTELSSRRGHDKRTWPSNNSLTIDTRRKTYDLKVGWNDSLKVNVLRTRKLAHGASTHESLDESGTLVFPRLEVKDQALPEDGSVLRGSIPVKDDTGKKLLGEVSWTLSAEPLPPVELRVEIKDYEDWRPEGSTSEGEPGNDLLVHAWLEGPDGGAVEDKATSFWFLLTEVTHQPGICINFPAKPKFPPDPDLKFLPEENSGTGTWAKARIDTSAVLEGEDLIDARATLSSFDWGGFAVLEVHAYLKSGRMLYGELGSEPGRTRIRIPKSDEGSWIADGWKEKTGATGADDDDEDAEPVGDARYKGDGLTLYEEYRGWHEGGRRHNDEFDGGGDPNRKEFFLCDLSGMYVRDVAYWLSELTKSDGAKGLRVIWNLEEPEITAQRVINFNHSDSRHRVDQHAVKLVRAPGLASEGLPIQTHAVGTPGRRGFVFVGGGPPGSTLDPYAKFRRILHELCHCCNVYDHGTPTREETIGASWTLFRDEDGSEYLREGPFRIRVIDEGTLRDVTQNYIRLLKQGAEHGLLSYPVRVGAWQGARCGNPYCLMTFTDPEVFKSRENPAARYLIRPTERSAGAFWLCRGEGGRGTLWNAPEHEPEPHFGPAAYKRGDCLDQLVVNDAANPEPR
ncbi:MAG TPA: hypothetical protein VFY93_15095 [Planctomycetota bacterium]|nr:hypothetical protein [Planctomycetota bacterium]